MAPGQLSPASGGPLIDPQGRRWTLIRRRLDLRIVRRAFRDGDRAVLLGDDGGCSLRWVDAAERSVLWERLRASYAGPGGDSYGKYMGCEFADDNGTRIIYVEVWC